MTIETSAKSVSPKVSDTADSRGRKIAGSTDAGPANGFLSILSALDESASVASSPAGGGEEKEVPIALVDIAQAATDLIANVNLDMTAVPRAQALQGQLAVPLVKPPDTLSVTATAAQPTVRAPVNAKVVAGDNLQVSDPMQGQVPVSYGDKSGAKSKALPAFDQSAGRALPESSRIQESRFMATLEAMRGVQDRGSAEPALIAGALASPIGEKPAAERGRFQERVTEGGFGAPSISLGTTSYASPAVQDGGAVSAEMYVAQEVAYWISQDVQNAELKLDGLGLEAVEVSITVHGNEAHVAFRTDELQARSMLEGAAAHLKEALRGEGLVLSGVSVGTSGGRDTGDNERKQRQGGRQTAAVPVSVQSAGTSRPHGAATGRTLDLFV